VLVTDDISLPLESISLL